MHDFEIQNTCWALNRRKYDGELTEVLYVVNVRSALSPRSQIFRTMYRPRTVSSKPYTAVYSPDTVRMNVGSTR